MSAAVCCKKMEVENHLLVFSLLIYVSPLSLSVTARSWEPGEADVLRGRAEVDFRRRLHQRGDEGRRAAAAGGARWSAAV